MNTPQAASRTQALIARMAHTLIAWRNTIAVVTTLITLVLGASALRTHLDAGFNKLIPLRHAYMAAFLQPLHQKRADHRAEREQRL